jgi:hypothetical protein
VEQSTPSVLPPETEDPGNAPAPQAGAFVVYRTGMPTEPSPVTLSQLARRAAELVDPQDEDADVAEFEEAFEDDDEPARALLEETLDERVAEAVRRIDPQGDLPQVQMAGAIVRYLAHKRTEVRDDREHILRLASRAEYHGDPPPAVADWLVDNGIDG